MANVSRGTVDRVIYNRGNVSEKSRLKVEKVLREINYSPNVNAKVLKLGKPTSVGVLFPSATLDIYWQKAKDGFMSASKELRVYNLEFHFYEFDNLNASQFKTMSHDAIENKHDAIIFAPFFNKESIDFVASIEKNNIPYILFNCNIDNGHQTPFVGQDLFQSGRIAGSLLYKLLGRNCQKVAIFHFDEPFENAPHMQQKQAGFEDFFISKGVPKHQVLTYNINEVEHTVESLKIKQVFDQHPDLQGVFVSTSKAYKIGHYVKKAGLDIRIVGCDLIPSNIDLVREEVIDIVLCQNIFHQAVKASKLLVDKIFSNRMLNEEYHVPVNICFKENIDFFK
ncbi:transcriptional regulator (plasmid) [Persicobacter psychrovividus]|uniref:Transcriptional regulator n=2 Tax=Persicobacter psychrovividus TaxID=387638 RepID=A0ABM7VMG3_9BACT|nr:transcriptional regulator [Persicobacter psychrovividus]